MPKRASTQAVITNSTNVMTQPAPRAGQKPTPPRSSAGTTRNIGSDGRTYQKVVSSCEAIRALSPVSHHSQMMAMTEISGSAATSALKAGLRLAISATSATINPDTAALMAKKSIGGQSFAAADG